MDRRTAINRIGLTSPLGFAAAGGTCGIKPSGTADLAIVLCERPCVAAGMFTTNRVVGAPVTVCKRHLKAGAAQAIVCNSGVANVCTGEAGIEDAIAMAAAVARAAPGEVANNQVLPCSTGVIGKRLPIEKILSGIERTMPRLARGPMADSEAARAIMTTDLVPKAAGVTVKIGGKEVTLGAIAKGSGMIAPNMATMLAFITTDADIDARSLKAALKQAVDVSFNRLSVDHDTSTSDSVLALASGLAGNKRITTRGEHFKAFAKALAELCRELAYQVISDGEGATKVFRVIVQGAASGADADRVGRTVVGSPLVKTAVHGGDPNWGRIAAAVGRSGAKVNPDKLDIQIGKTPVLEAGQPVKLKAAAAGRVERAMAQKEVVFTINLHQGKGSSEWLGCDLSREYVTINADYTT